MRDQYEVALIHAFVAARKPVCTPDCGAPGSTASTTRAIQRLAPGFEVGARSPEDRSIEAIGCHEGSYIVGVQWHPEFPTQGGDSPFDDQPLLHDFLQACAACAACPKARPPAAAPKLPPWAGRTAAARRSPAPGPPCNHPTTPCRAHAS